MTVSFAFTVDLFILKGRDFVNDIASLGCCTERSRSYPCRHQLEQDVSYFLSQIVHLISMFILCCAAQLLDSV